VTVLCPVCGLPLVIERTPDNQHPWCKERHPMSGRFLSPDPGTQGEGCASLAAYLILVAIIIAASGIWAWIGR
jgi:hypothetical protein